MRGEVISRNADGGLIAGEDGARYAFTPDRLRGVVNLGDRVDFLALEGVAHDVVPLAPATAPGASTAGLSAAGAGYAQAPSYDFIHALFSLNGRLRRSHFWISWAILFFGFWVWAVIPFLNFLLLLAFPVIIWGNFAVATKRFHDMGMTGWLIAIPWGLSLVSNITGLIALFAAYGADGQDFQSAGAEAMAGSVMAGSSLVGLASFAVSIGFWLWLGIAEGARGPNRFGPDPKNPIQDQAAVFS